MAEANGMIAFQRWNLPLFFLLATLCATQSKAEVAPKCSDEPVVGFLVGFLLDQAGIKLGDDKVQFVFGGEMGLDVFEDVVSLEIDSIRERGYENEIMKRYCTGEVKITVDMEKFSLLKINETEKGPFIAMLGLGQQNGTTNYSVQIIDDGSTFVTVGE